MKKEKKKKQRRAEFMNKIEGYQVYKNDYNANALQNQQSKEAEKKNKTEKTDNTSQVQLSDKAKKLLDQLKKKYGNMDFIVADYKSDEEASAYLSRGTKEYSVLIEPDILEEMANDKDAKDKYLGILNDATAKLDDFVKQLGDKKNEVTNMGVSIGKDGSVSYFAELEKVSEKQRERIDKAREEKKEARREERPQDRMMPDKTKRTRVEADSLDELLEKINKVDWNNIQAQERKESGSRFDFSV